MYRVLIVRDATHPDPRDFTVITDSAGRKWDEIAGSVPFDAGAAQLEELRTRLTDFIRAHVPSF